MTEQQEVIKPEIKLEIKNMKLAEGQETPLFELSLYVNDKRSAIVSNKGTGGCHQWKWIDKANEKLFAQHVKELTESGYFESSCYSDPRRQEDALIYEMIDKLEENQLLKRLCKKHLVFTLLDEENPEDGVHTVNAPYNEITKEYVTKKYGERLKEIINERFVTPIAVAKV